jgi:CheY-like chemotaxis protein
MRKINVLLIEDNLGDVLLTLEALQESKYLIHLDPAKNGKEGPDYLFSTSGISMDSRPDLVLLDINLSLKSGYEVLHEVKQKDFTRPFPVVMLSTSSAQGDIVRSFQQQKNCYLVKNGG